MSLIKSKEKYKILLLEGVHPTAVKYLEGEGFEITYEKTALLGQELVDKAKAYHAIGIRSKTQVTQEVLSQLPNLQVVGAFCIGTNQVQLNYANEQGVPVFNAPYANTRSVAELVISEIIALSRRLGDINNKAHKGEWSKSAQGSYEVRGKVLGIVGYGHIGSQVSVLAEALGLKVFYYDIVKKLPLGNAQSVESLDELLALSDFLTLHVPATEATKSMIAEKQIKKMKKGSFLVNASRGTVVDIPSLAKAIESDHLAGAAIDVFPEEPSNNQEAFQSELQGLKNIILTPHIGGSTEEAQESIGQEVAESLVSYLHHGNSYGAVNFPNLEVPILRDQDVLRLLNVHKNVPGVMSQLNSIVSEFGVNIRRQYLSTDNQIGYVVMDIEKGQVENLAEKIDELETSIKTRVLKP